MKKIFKKTLCPEDILSYFMVGLLLFFQINTDGGEPAGVSDSYPVIMTKARPP